MTNTDASPESAVRQEKSLGFGFALVLGLMAALCSVLSAGVGVVLPDIAKSLNISTILSIWVISGFSLAYGVSMAVYGRAGDIKGLRLPLTVGTCLMAIGSLFSALAVNFPMLMVGRILQGIGGASIPVLAVAIITNFDNTYLQTKGLALVTGIASAGAGLGPLIGGGLARVFSWRLSLGVTSLVIILLALIWRRIPAKASTAKLDVVGAVLVAIVASGVILIVQSAATGKTIAIIGTLAFLCGLPTLIFWIRTHPNGFLPDAVIKNKAVVRVTLACTCVPIAWFSLLVAVPLVFHTLGWSPIQIGLVLAPSALNGFTTSRLAAGVISRIGSNRTLIISGALSTVALLFGFIGGHYSLPFFLAGSVFLVTGAFGFAQPAMVAEINKSVEESVRGVALGTAIMTLFASGSMGAAVVGGFADVIGIDFSLLVLTLFPLYSISLLWNHMRVKK